MFGVLVSLAFPGGCGRGADIGGDGGIDSAGGDDVDASPYAGLSCAELRQAFSTIIDGTSRACGDRDDCGLAGIELSIGLCECRPSIGPCQGVPVELAAYQATNGRLLENEYEARCQACSYEVPCTCDCNGALYDCVDGECTATGQMPCLPGPPDAAPTDAAHVDAPAGDGGTADAG